MADIQTAVNLIGSTSTEKGLKVICKADYNNYELAKQVPDDEYQSIYITRIMLFGEWNNVIKYNSNFEVSYMPLQLTDRVCSLSQYSQNTVTNLIIVNI